MPESKSTAGGLGAGSNLADPLAEPELPMVGGRTPVIVVSWNGREYSIYDDTPGNWPWQMLDDGTWLQSPARAVGKAKYYYAPTRAAAVQFIRELLAHRELVAKLRELQSRMDEMAYAENNQYLRLYADELESLLPPEQPNGE